MRMRSEERGGIVNIRQKELETCFKEAANLRSRMMFANLNSQPHPLLLSIKMLERNFLTLHFKNGNTVSIGYCLIFDRVVN